LANFLAPLFSRQFFALGFREFEQLSFAHRFRHFHRAPSLNRVHLLNDCEQNQLLTLRQKK
jgi:hypothetical protein